MNPIHPPEVNIDGIASFVKASGLARPAEIATLPGMLLRIIPWMFLLFAPVAMSANFSRADDQFLDKLERDAFLFFWEQADPKTGLVKDRSRADGKDERHLASIASTGFGLTALCIAAERGY